MKRRFYYKAMLIASLVVFMYGCRHEAHDDHEEPHTEPAAEHSHEVIHFSSHQAEAAGVEVETVAPRPFSAAIAASGRILAAGGDEQVLVAPTSGTVVYARGTLGEGISVRRGEPLFYIRSGVTLDGDPAVRVRSEYEAAMRDFQRAERLLQDRLIARRDYEAAKLRAEQAKAAYEALGHREGEAGRIAVTAGLDGFLKSASVASGEYVAAGQPMAVIAANRRLLLRAEVSERYFSALSEAGSAHFRLPYSSRIYKMSDLNGRIVSVGTVSGAAAPYVPVTFEFDNAGGILAGSFVEVWLLCAERAEAITVPTSALTEEQGLYFVYLKVDAEDYKKQEVEIGQTDGTRVEILKGLRAGDEVVVRGAYQIRLASVSSIVPEGHNHNH